MLRRFSFSLVLMCTCLFNLHGFAQSASELYQQAGQLYKAKQFQQAADLYEKIISQGYKSTDVYYNLGNCYFKIDSVGKCILNYERAQKLSPDDEDVKHNLQLASLHTIDKIEPVPQLAIITWWNNFISFFSSKTWGIFSLAALWLALIIAAIGIFSGMRRFFFGSAALIFLVSIIFLSLAIFKQTREKRSDVAILTASSANVKSAPDENSSNLFLLHEGTKLQLLDHVGNWNKIQLADGKVGWIDQGSFEKI